MTEIHIDPVEQEDLFQLTSSRRGWRIWWWKFLYSNRISTHILTKRMTLFAWRNVTMTDISTHILTKRMTPSVRYIYPSQVFQLTSSRRGWLFQKIHWFGKIISTHILTKRMTKRIQFCECNDTFQLTSSRRGWPTGAFYYKNFSTFQLTSSRRGWHWINRRIETGSDFNSHPHEEDDTLNSCVFLSSHISTHILTKRMTDLELIQLIHLIFQLTSSRRGWRLFCLRPCRTDLYFNSHPHEEDDRTRSWYN